jgi:hypothetical protein
MPRITGGCTAPVSDDDDLCVRAAWLHYCLGLTQAEVAGRLGTTNVKAHRLIARANRLGIVHVSIDGAVSECFALEGKIAARYGLDFCQVAPDLVGSPPIDRYDDGATESRHVVSRQPVDSDPTYGQADTPAAARACGSRLRPRLEASPSGGTGQERARR